ETPYYARNRMIAKLKMRLSRDISARSTSSLLRAGRRSLWRARLFLRCKALLQCGRPLLDKQFRAAPALPGAAASRVSVCPLARPVLFECESSRVHVRARTRAL